MKRTILILTNYTGHYTGFGRNAKAMLTYLFKKYGDRFNFVLAAAGNYYYNPDFERWPWETHGTIPNNPQELGNLAQDPNAMRGISYGAFAIEMLVFKYKPDVIFAIEDEWGVNFIKEKEFFKYIPTIFWVTLDSLPILDKALDTASRGPHYWVWSQFAEKAMKKVDPEKYKHVITQYPCFDTSKYFKLPEQRVAEIKAEHKLPPDSKIVGFVFRNQLRKLVNKLIEGYALFKKENPHIKNTYLYTHTHYSENPECSWNIPALCKEFGVPQEEVLCTYICRATKKYFILPFKGQDLDNPVTGQKGSLVTVNVVDGVSEEHLNEIYNLFDLYIHPATSGACEMPCVEAALTERIIATSDYSFGEDIIQLNKGSLNIKYDIYKEVQTGFNKSNQKSESIAHVIKTVLEMGPTKKLLMGRDSRQWALDNYSTEINAEKIIQRIDRIPPHGWDFQYKTQQKNPNAIIPPIPDDGVWVKRLYSDILNMVVDDQDDGYKSWIIRLKHGQPRQEVEQYFRQVAGQENAKIGKQTSLSDLIDNTGRKTFLVVIPESLGDCLMATALLKNLKESNPETDIYIATKQENIEIFDGNPYIHKVILYHPIMESEIACTGQGSNKGYFDKYCHLTIGTQRQLNYLTNTNLSLL